VSPFRPGLIFSSSDFKLDCDVCGRRGKEPMRCAIRGFTSIPTTTYLIMATMTTVSFLRAVSLHREVLAPSSHAASHASRWDTESTTQATGQGRLRARSA